MFTLQEGKFDKGKKRQINFVMFCKGKMMKQNLIKRLRNKRYY